MQAGLDALPPSLCELMSCMAKQGQRVYIHPHCVVEAEVGVRFRCQQMLGVFDNNMADLCHLLLKAGKFEIV